MSNPNEVAGWIARAEEDYTLARLAFRRQKPLIYGATFHAQQCAEKYLKAILMCRDQAFPKTHDLAALSDLCKQNEITIPVAQEALERLTAYAVQVRYTDELPELDDAREAIQIARKARDFASKLVKKFLEARQ